MATLKFYIAGGGQVSLSNKDFVAQGGEGKIYAKQQWAYKIYTDPSKMIAAAKIRELSHLKHPAIICPHDILLDKNNVPVGFSMPNVANAVALARLFTNDYRSQNQITEAMTLKLIEQIQAAIVFIHSHQCLIVDGNEMNYLVDTQDYSRPYLIDVDSYQTPSFAATAQLPSIRDYHSKGFSELTDWFAFAIIACQLLVGIHPYKGKHPDFKKHDLVARMQANVSIFNPTVSLPAAVRDFSVIPPNLYTWFIQLFEKGQRLSPPSLAQAQVMPKLKTKVVQSSQNFSIKLLQTFNAAIRYHNSYYGTRLVVAGTVAYIEQTEYPLPAPDSRVIFEPKTQHPYAVYCQSGNLQVMDLINQQSHKLSLKANDLLKVGNQLYSLYGEQLTQILFHYYNQKTVVSPGKSWQIMPQAHQVLDGLLYQNVLGKAYLVIPYQNACMVQPVPELDGYQIITGKHEQGVVMLVVTQAGQYQRFILRFDAQYNHYDIRIQDDVELLENNFTCLDNGLVVFISQDGELEIFQRSGDAHKVVQDAQIHTAMQLAQEGTAVMFYSEQALYAMQMQA